MAFKRVLVWAVIYLFIVWAVIAPWMVDAKKVRRHRLRHRHTRRKVHRKTKSPSGKALMVSLTPTPPTVKGTPHDDYPSSSPTPSSPQGTYSPSRSSTPTTLVPTIRTAAPFGVSLPDVYISCGSEDYACDLQNALDSTTANITIVLASDVIVTSTIHVLGNRQVTIRGALNVDTRPQLIGSNTRLFAVENGGTIILRDLVLTAGLSTDLRGGGAILLRRFSTLIAEDVQFSNHQATSGDGGAIWSDSSNLYLHQCDFVNNRASMGDGGAIAMSLGYIQVTSSNFSTNNAFFSGGAIRTSGSSFILFNSTFADNIARSGGACAFSETIQGTTHSSKFLSNEAAYGGALIIANAKVTILASVFAYNTAWDTTSEGIYVQKDGSSITPSVYLVNLDLDFQDSYSFINLVQLSANGQAVSPVADCLAKAPAKAPACTLPLCSICSRTRLLPLPHNELSCSCASTGDLAIPLGPHIPSDKFLVDAFYPGICFHFSITSLFPSTCVTSGGYVQDGTTCYADTCLPVSEDDPHIKSGTAPNSGDGDELFWCPTVAKYSSSDVTTRNSWGYCGVECGYATLMPKPGETGRPTMMPTTPSPTDTSDESEYEYEYEGQQYFVPWMYSAAYVGYYGTYVEVAFDCVTDCGGNCNLPLPCTYYFVQAGPQWVCQWTTRKRLAIYQSSAIRKLTLLPQNSIACRNAYGPPRYATGSVRVSGAKLIPAPNVVLIAPSIISLCATKDLILDGTSTRVLSVGGIASVLWELRWTDPSLDFFASDIADLRATLDACSTQRSLYCTTGTLPYQGRFAFALTVANAFGTTATASSIVQVTYDTSPLLIRFAGGNLVYARYSGDASQPNLVTQLAATVTLLSQCSAGANSTDVQGMEDGIAVPLQILWQITAPKTLAAATFAQQALISTPDPYVINFAPANLQLSPSQALPFDVTVRLFAYLDDGDQTDYALGSYSDLVVRIVPTPLVLEIVNSNRTLADYEKSLLVVGKVVSGGRFTQEQLEYVWTCTCIMTNKTGVPCTGLSLSMVNLSQPDTSSVFLSTTQPGSKYVFTFTAIGATDPRTASVAGYFRTLDASSVNVSDPGGKTPPPPPVVQLQTQRPATTTALPDTTLPTSPSPSVFSGPRLNRDRPIRVKGVCPDNSTSSWNLLQTDFDTDHSNLLQLLPSAVVTPSGTLGDGRYTLTLTCVQLSSLGRVLFGMNRAPYGGTLAVSPSQGNVFSTVFTLRATGWVDDEGDLPLRYDFERVFVDDNTGQVTSRSLAPLSTWATWQTRLPLKTTSIRLYTVDSLGGVSDYVQLPVAVLAPTVVSQYMEWFSPAVKRWKRDWDYKQRSGVDVLSEISMSILPLANLSIETVFVEILALGMAKVALSNLGSVITADDLGEDAKIEIMSGILLDLARYLPSNQAADELLDGLISWQSSSVTVRGAMAAFQATLFPLSLMLSLNDGNTAEIDCAKLNRKASALPTVFNDTKTTLLWDIIALANETLGCTDQDWTYSTGQTGRRRALTSSIDTQTRFMQALGQVSNASLDGALAGEAPMTLISQGGAFTGTTFQTWRLSSFTKPKVLEMNDYHSTRADVVGPTDTFVENDDVWMLTVNGSVEVTLEDSTTATTTGTMLYCGGSAFDRWEQLLIRNMFVNLSSLIPSEFLANASNSSTSITLNGDTANFTVSFNETVFFNETVPVNDTSLTSANSTNSSMSFAEWEQTTVHSFSLDVSCQQSLLPYSSSQAPVSSSCQVVSVDPQLFTFDCLCTYAWLREARRRLQTSVSVASNGYTVGMQASNAFSQAAPLDPVIVGGGVGVPNGPYSSAPTFINETRTPTTSPTQSLALTIVPSQQNQAWISIIILLCVCLGTLMLGMWGVYLDRREETRKAKARFLLTIYKRGNDRRMQRQFFTKMRWAQLNNVYLTVDERRSARAVALPPNDMSATIRIVTREYLWIAFAKRHAWLAPVFAPSSLTSPRSSRVVLLFAVLAGNMGLCSVFLLIGWSNVALIGFVSALCMACATWLLDKFGRGLMVRWQERRLTVPVKKEYSMGSTSSLSPAQAAVPGLTLNTVDPVKMHHRLKTPMGVAAPNIQRLKTPQIGDGPQNNDMEIKVAHKQSSADPYKEQPAEEPKALGGRMDSWTEPKPQADEPMILDGRVDSWTQPKAAHSENAEELLNEATLGERLDSWTQPKSATNEPQQEEEKLIITREEERSWSSYAREVRSIESWASSHQHQDDGLPLAPPLQNREPWSSRDDQPETPRKEAPIHEMDTQSDASWNENRLVLIQGDTFMSTKIEPTQATYKPPQEDDIEGWSWKSQDNLASPPPAVASFVLHDSSPAKSTVKPTIVWNDKLSKRAPYCVLITSKLPVALLGWLGGAFAVFFNASLAGQSRFGPWVAAWAVSLIFDLVVIQTLLGFARVSAAVYVAMKRRRRERDGEDEESALPSPLSSQSFRWQARPRTPQGANDDDLLLMEALGDAASVDTDTEARELLELIMGMTVQSELQMSGGYSEDPVGHFNVVAAGGNDSTTNDDRSSAFHQLQATKPATLDQTKVASVIEVDIHGNEHGYTPVEPVSESPVQSSGDGGTPEGSVLDLVQNSERIRHETIV